MSAPHAVASALQLMPDCTLLTASGAVAGRAGRSEAIGLLRHAHEADGSGSRWCFADEVLPAEALSLAQAALRPLHELEQPAEEAAWFGPADPWRRAPGLDALGDWLARRTSRTAAAAVAPAAEQALHADPALTMRRDAASGRGLHVSSACAAGRLLLREEAFAAVLRRAHAATHCAFCLRPLGAASAAAPCCRCGGCGERYCGEACRATALAHGHADECGTRWAAVAPVTALLAARALLRLRAKPSDGSQADANAGGDEESEESGRGWAHASACEACARLQSHAGSLRPERLSRLRLHAELGWRALGGALAARGHRASDLLRLLCQTETNTIAIGAELPAGTGGDGAGGGGVAGGGSGGGGHGNGRGGGEGWSERTRHVRLAEALFPFTALLNHSCAPNTALRFDGRRLEVRASSDLKAGDQVLGCYGPQKGHAPCAARRAALRSQYFFACACAACAEEAAEEAQRGEKPGGGCARGEAEAAAPAAATADALAMAARLDERARVACDAADFATAAALVAEAIELLEARGVFAPGGVELANERAKLGRLQFNAAPAGSAPGARARRTLTRAAKALSLLHGSDDEEVQELRRLAAMCDPAAP